LTAHHLTNDQAAYSRNADIGAVVMMMVIIAIVTVVMVMVMVIIAVVTVMMMMMVVVVVVIILGELDTFGGLGLESGVVGDERLFGVWNRRQQVGVGSRCKRIIWCLSRSRRGLRAANGCDGRGRAQQPSDFLVHFCSPA
jgi:hypothetical protein